MVDVVAVCGNNITHPVVFFGSDDIEDMNDFCEFTGTLRFLTEFKERTEMTLKILDITGNGALREFVESHKHVWNIVCVRVDNPIFRKAMLGKWDHSCGNTNLWYVHLFIIMSTELFGDLTFVVARDFTGCEQDEVVMIRAQHTPDWTKVLQYDSLDEFITSEDIKNGHLD